jgi:hypothetical protein
LHEPVRESPRHIQTSSGRASVHTARRILRIVRRYTFIYFYFGTETTISVASTPLLKETSLRGCENDQLFIALLSVDAIPTATTPVIPIACVTLCLLMEGCVLDYTQSRKFCTASNSRGTTSRQRHLPAGACVAASIASVLIPTVNIKRQKRCFSSRGCKCLLEHVYFQKTISVF